MTDPALRDAKGRLVAGSRMGRPAGTSLIEGFRKRMGQHWLAIEVPLVTAAKEGDVRAAELLADRMVPKPRPQAELVRVPGLRDAIGSQAKADAVLAAVAEGHVSP